jgi:hypothetical protein
MVAVTLHNLGHRILANVEFPPNFPVGLAAAAMRKPTIIVAFIAAQVLRVLWGGLRPLDDDGLQGGR